MEYLQGALAEKVAEWRTGNYSYPNFPSISEILEFATDNPTNGRYRYLRSAQFKALEIYWYLSLVEKTPKIPQLYERLYPKARGRREAMGRTSDEIRDYLEDESWDALYQNIYCRSTG